MDEPAGAPALVSFIPLTFRRSPRLSGHFSHFLPVTTSNRPASFSPPRCLINADEAGPWRAAAGWPDHEKSQAWQFSSPTALFLAMAMVGLASADSEKNQTISRLRKSLDLRDETVLRMQQKLDELSKEVSDIKGKEKTRHDENDAESLSGWRHCCNHHKAICAAKNCLREDGVLQSHHRHHISANDVEQDERRMSDLSDWASSAASTAETQVNTFAANQDIFNLPTDSKGAEWRIANFEDVILKKNLKISQLKSEITALQQKLTQVQKSSSSPSLSRELPFMVENIISNLESTASSSSSDSGSSPTTRMNPLPIRVRDAAFSSSSSSSSSTVLNSKLSPVNKSHAGTDMPRAVTFRSQLAIQKSEATQTAPSGSANFHERKTAIGSSNNQLSLKAKSPPNCRDHRKTRSPTQNTSKEKALKKRWVYIVQPRGCRCSVIGPKFFGVPSGPNQVSEHSVDRSTHSPWSGSEHS